MENNLIYKVYDFFNHIIHPNDIRLASETITRKCPVTGLDISMQPKNSRFLSSSGVKWYYENDKKTYDKELAIRLSENSKNKDLHIQFRRIAHNIRNEESNPRNNTRRTILKLLNEKNNLFNNMQLIDKSKLHKAGIIKDS